MKLHHWIDLKSKVNVVQTVHKLLSMGLQEHECYGF